MSIVYLGNELSEVAWCDFMAKYARNACKRAPIVEINKCELRASCSSVLVLAMSNLVCSVTKRIHQMLLRVQADNFTINWIIKIHMLQCLTLGLSQEAN